MSQFVAWDGKTYDGSPPEGWVPSTDGRWWPPQEPAAPKAAPAPGPLSPPAEGTPAPPRRGRPVLGLVVVLSVIGLAIGAIALIAALQDPLATIEAAVQDECVGPNSVNRAGDALRVTFVDGSRGADCSFALRTAAIFELEFDAGQVNTVYGGGTATTNGLQMTGRQIRSDNEPLATIVVDIFEP